MFKEQENNTILIELVNINDNDESATSPAQSLGPSRHKIISLAGSSDVVPPEKEQNQLDAINDTV